jgi:hypothetical protein
MDEVKVDDAGSEKDHGVTFEGATFEEKQKLPEGNAPDHLIEDNGRGFKGYYQFTLKTMPGFTHRLWVRVNTGHNMTGMALEVQVGDKWIQLGIRTQNDEITRHFESIYFEVPSKYLTSNQTVFQLISKYGDEINAYHLWIYKLDDESAQPLPEILGINSSKDLGSVGHGLIPKSTEWMIPLTLSQHPDQAAIMVLKVGKGYLVRSELSLDDSINIIKSLLGVTAISADE